MISAYTCYWDRINIKGVINLFCTLYDISVTFNYWYLFLYHSLYPNYLNGDRFHVKIDLNIGVDLHKFEPHFEVAFHPNKIRCHEMF